MIEFLKEYAGRPIHELPSGATGCSWESAEQALNDMVDGGVNLTEGSDFLRAIPQTYSFPETCQVTDFIKILDQRQKLSLIHI